MRFFLLLILGWGLAGGALAQPGGVGSGEAVIEPRPLSANTSEWKQSLTLFGAAEIPGGV